MSLGGPTFLCAPPILCARMQTKPSEFNQVSGQTPHLPTHHSALHCMAIANPKWVWIGHGLDMDWDWVRTEREVSSSHNSTTPTTTHTTTPTTVSTPPARKGKRPQPLSRSSLDHLLSLPPRQKQTQTLMDANEPNSVVDSPLRIPSKGRAAGLHTALAPKGWAAVSAAEEQLGFPWEGAAASLVWTGGHAAIPLASSQDRRAPSRAHKHIRKQSRLRMTSGRAPAIQYK